MNKISVATPQINSSRNISVNLSSNVNSNINSNENSRLDIQSMNRKLSTPALLQNYVQLMPERQPISKREGLSPL